jgi:hypothetical protein
MTNNCIIYIKINELSKWNNYMYKLRTTSPELPPTFRTFQHTYDLSPDQALWIQMLIDIDDLQRIYDLMDEYATMAENYNEK